MAEEQKFEQLRSDRDRRNFVAEAFKNDTLKESEAAKAFFIEQFNKGELIYEDASSIEKIAGFLNIAEKQEASYNDHFTKPLQEKTKLVASNTGNIHEETTEQCALGQEIKEEIEKNQTKSAEQRAKQQADITVLKGLMYGLSDEEKQENVNKLYEQAKTLGFWRFKARNNIIKQLKAIDPDKFWAKERHNPITLTGKLLYDDKKVLGTIYDNYIEIRQNNTPAKKAQKHDERLKEIIALQDVVNGTKLFSKYGWEKIKARWGLLWRRSPEKKAAAWFKNLKIKDFPEVEAKLQKKLKDAEAHKNDPIKDNRKKYRAKAELLSKLLELAKETHKQREQKYNQELKAINSRTIVAPADSKLIENIAANAQKWEAERQKSLAKDPQIMAYNKLLEMAAGNDDLRKKIESAANARQDKQITADRVFEAVMKQNGFSDEEIAIFKQEYVPDINKPVDAKPDDHKEEEKTLDDKAKEEKSSEEKSKEQTEEESKEPKAEGKTEGQTEEPKAEEKTEGNAEEPKTEKESKEPKAEEKNEEKEAANVTKNPVLNDGPVSEHSEQNRTSESLDSIFTSSAYEKIEKSVAESATFKNKENGRMVTVEKTDDGNYYVTAKTQDGKDDKAQVDELVAVIKDMTKDGSKTIELGEVKSAEFLARAELAAEKAGITISNLEEKKKEVCKDNKYEELKKAEKEFANAQSVLRGIEIDVSTDEGVNKTVDRMEALVKIRDLDAEGYADYKNSDEFKNLGLNDKEVKRFDDVNKLKTDKEFAKLPEAKQAAMLGRLITGYVAACRKEGKGKTGEEKRKVAAHIIKNNARNLGLNDGR